MLQNVTECYIFAAAAEIKCSKVEHFTVSERKMRGRGRMSSLFLGRRHLNMKRNKILALVALTISTFLTTNQLFAADAVKVWEEQTVIPTYLIGPPDPNPQFYVGDSSQGAEKRIYPYPLYDNLLSEKANKSYKIVYLENEYIKVGILPESGGKIFEAVDKTNGYNFFYRQHVIKPTLISLLGAWISGGVEWDLPHHHRATSFIPVQHSIEKNADGTQTVWVGELELRDRMRWAVGATLHPGKSVLEVSFRMVNRTPVPVSMLAFSNVAVHTNENYQIIFPPSTQFGTGHSKRQMVGWPINREVDISWWKNNSTTSVFAWNYQEDFMAGYDHGRRAGTMTVADHNVVPGKKFFTWGTSNLQYKLLTDDDGPYIELMVGAYSDNQPDYSWMQPYETRTWKQNWYPFRDIDGVKNANTEAAVNLEVKDGKATVGLFATSNYPEAQVSLKLKDQVLLSEKVSINPAKAYVKEVAIPAGADEHDLRAAMSVGGVELIAYSPIKLTPQEAPPGVTNYPQPSEIKTNEELYLTGLRIDQFRDPQREPEPYWEEALKRDPGDIRVNTALAINYYKKARYADAEKLLRTAVARATDRYTSPMSGDPFYYLGLTLKAQGKNDEAFSHFYKSTWSAAWRSPGYFEAAQIASIRGDTRAAMQFVSDSIEGNAVNIRAVALKSALLRATGRPQEALALAPVFQRIDPLDVRGMAELSFAGNAEAMAKLSANLKDFPITGLEVAADYLNAGLWKDGTSILTRTIEAAPDKSKVSPMVYYYLAYFAGKLNQPQKASEYLQLAAKAPTDYVFPFQREAIDVLEQAMAANPLDARAPYYLGNLLYDWQPDRAVGLWEKSVALKADFPVVYRNLAWVYRQQNAESDKVFAMLGRAAQFGGNAMVFSELDQFYEAQGISPQERLAILEKNSAMMNRDEVVARLVNLKILAGKYDEAISLMKSRQFRTWEGGSGRSMGDAWVNAMLRRGQQNLKAKRYKEALSDFQAAGTFPDNLAEATAAAGDAHRSEINYWIGVAYDASGDKEKAKQSWSNAAGMSANAPTTAPGRGGRGGRGNRGGALGAGLRVAQANSYYQAMSLMKLGETDRAKAMFQQLIDAGTQALTNAPDPQASPTAAQRITVADAHYIVGLGQLGLDNKEKANQEFAQAIKASPDHLAATSAMAALSQ